MSQYQFCGLITVSYRSGFMCVLLTILTFQWFHHCVLNTTTSSRRNRGVWSIKSRKKRLR